MAHNDHYVSQTYLKGFTGPGGNIIPYYKNAHVIAGSPKKPKSICFETEGDRSKYLQDPRWIDRFLPRFENPWKSNVASVENGRLDADTRFDLCGYIAYLRACTPTAKRLGQKMIAGCAEPPAYQYMMQNLKENTELSLELKTHLAKAVQGRQIRMRIDREFAHAQAVAALFNVLARLYCSRWLIMINDSNTPFITSDNPAVLYRASAGQRVADIYVPLTPRTGVLISPDLRIGRPDLAAVKGYDCTGKSMFGVMKQSCIMRFNEAIVKNAESVVLHEEKTEWVEKLVRKYRHWRTETIVSQVPTEGGMFVLTSSLAVDTKKSAMSRDRDQLLRGEGQ